MKQGVPNIRLQALKLAQEMLQWTRELHKTQGAAQIGPDHSKEEMELPEAVETLLLVFLKTKRFDLYFQSPWIASNAMGIVLEEVQSLVLQLLNNSTVRNVVWMYHLVRHFELDCPQIDILDRVCSLLVRPYFAASHPPTANFLRVYMRVSGTIKRDTSDGYGKPKLKVAKDTSKRVTPGFSMFYRLNLKNGRSALHSALRDPDIPKLIGKQGHSESSGSKETYPKDDISKACLSNLIKLEGLLKPDFEGDFPVAKVSFVRLFKECSDIHVALNEEIFGSGFKRRPGAAGAAVLLYEPLSYIDRQLDKGDISAVKNYPVLILMRDLLEEMFRGKELKDYVWQNM
jgi:hypothetical protein